MILCSTLYANLPVNFGLQQPHANKESPFIYSLGVFKNLKKSFYYYEGGILIQPNFTNNTQRIVNDEKFEKKYDHSSFGFYGGYHLLLNLLFRPGVIIGSTLKKEDIQTSWKDLKSQYTKLESLQVRTPRIA